MFLQFLPANVWRWNVSPIQHHLTPPTLGARNDVRTRIPSTEGSDPSGSTDWTSLAGSSPRRKGSDPNDIRLSARLSIHMSDYDWYAIGGFCGFFAAREQQISRVFSSRCGLGLARRSDYWARHIVIIIKLAINTATRRLLLWYSVPLREFEIISGFLARHRSPNPPCIPGC